MHTPDSSAVQPDDPSSPRPAANGARGAPRLALPVALRLYLRCRRWLGRHLAAGPPDSASPRGRTSG
jgi:hypothetical protein